MSRIEINQDRECSESGEIGCPMPVFWAKGHGYKADDFIDAVWEYCREYEADLPSISWDEMHDIQEVWQQNVSRYDGIEYRRTDQAPTSTRSPKFPITILDLERRRRGGTKCAVSRCDEPWASGASAQVRISPDENPENLSYMAVHFYLCREHQKQLPEPSYRVCLVPVGATIMLPSPDEVTT